MNKNMNFMSGVSNINNMRKEYVGKVTIPKDNLDSLVGDLSKEDEEDMKRLIGGYISKNS